MIEAWLKKLFAKKPLLVPQEVPEDHQRRARRLEAEKQTLQSMRRLAINESDPQFLQYVMTREDQLESLIDAQLHDEFDVITERQGRREESGGRDSYGADDT